LAPSTLRHNDSHKMIITSDKLNRFLTILTRCLVGTTIATIAISLLSAPSAPLNALSPTTVLANDTCGTQQNHQFDGWEADKQGGWGAQDWIVVQSAPLCTNGYYQSGDFGNSSSAWALLGPADNLQFAQAGYDWQIGNSQALYFVEWQDPSCAYQQRYEGGYNYCMRTWGSVANSHNDHYQVFAASNNHVVMEIDGTVVGQTSYVANCTNDWCGPWGEEWNGETSDPGNNMPGSSPVSNRTSFTTVQYQLGLGGSWSAPSYTVKPGQADPSMLYCQIQQTSQSFNIFTAPNNPSVGCS
jgi:hypothetical protein